MNHSKSLIIGFFAVSILFSQCKNSKDNSSENQKDSLSNATDEKIEVTVIPLKRTTFYKEIVSNGKLNAVRKADLSFKVSETIDRIEVKNGTAVQANQLIASLDNFFPDFQHIFEVENRKCFFFFLQAAFYYFGNI